MKEEKVAVDETFTIKFEDAVQVVPAIPAIRIKQEPTDFEAVNERKVFANATTQTETLETRTDLNIEIESLKQRLAFSIIERVELKRLNEELARKEETFSHMKQLVAETKEENVRLKAQIKHLNEFEIHQLLHVEQKGRKICKICRKRFVNPDQYARHLRLFH